MELFDKLLISKSVSKPISRLIIIDWDDTLFPTTHVQNNNIKTKHIKKNININTKLFKKLDTLIFNLLSNLNKYGKVIIVTNAAEKWVHMTLKILPKTKEFVDNNVNIVSARDMYKKKFPNNAYEWKRQTFKKVVNSNFANKSQIQQIISIGDAEYEYRALIDLYNKNNKSNKSNKSNKPKRILKSVKLIRYPKIDILLDELEVLDKSVYEICNNKTHMDLNFN
jgi:hypothetical protein